MPLSTDLSLGSLRGTIAGIVDKFICDFGVESVTACCWDWIGFSGGLGASAAAEKKDSKKEVICEITKVYVNVKLVI